MAREILLEIEQVRSSLLFEAEEQKLQKPI
jgi:hypothetical protein